MSGLINMGYMIWMFGFTMIFFLGDVAMERSISPWFGRMIWVTTCMFAIYFPLIYERYEKWKK